MTKIKICGITTLKDAQMAADAGADMLGFVFYPSSPRCLSLENAAKITGSIRTMMGDNAPKLVGVFVDVPPDTVSGAYQLCQLDYVQLHGRESPVMISQLNGRGIRVIKAIRVRDHDSLAQIEHYRAEAILLDAYRPNNPGGTGQCFDWSLAIQLQTQRPIILAGGLTHANVAEAIKQVHPWAVDVSSGVETLPGQKDSRAVTRFIQVVKNRDGGIA